MKTSHFTIYTVGEIKNLTVQLACQAMEWLAKELGGTMINQLTSAYWDQQAIISGFRTKNLPNGIGIRIENGQLQICGDSYHQEKEYNRIQKLIPNAITIHQIKQIAKNQRQTTKTTIKGKVIQLEVNY